MFYFPNAVVLFTGDCQTFVATYQELFMECYSGTVKLTIRFAANAYVISMETGGTFLHMGCVFPFNV
jgi:hypothetical protein